MMYKNYLKHFLDFLISLVGLLLLSPVFFTVFIILSIQNSGAPFFFQKRTGKNEQLFKIIKFKTMTDAKDSEGKLLSDAERVTKLGSTIRKTSLDEIPQLINVIKGDMSLVGPRPLLPQYLEFYKEEEKKRHDVRPGITGLAQVNGRNHLGWDERLALDAHYADNCSLRMDLKIIFKTVYQVISRKDTVAVPGEFYTTLDKYRRNEIKS